MEMIAVQTLVCALKIQMSLVILLAMNLFSVARGGQIYPVIQTLHLMDFKFENENSNEK